MAKDRRTGRDLAEKVKTRKGLKCQMMMMMMMKYKCIDINYIRHLPCCDSGLWVLQELQQDVEWLQKTENV